MLFDPPEVPAFDTFDMAGRLEFIESANARYPLRPMDSVGTKASIGPDPGGDNPVLTTEDATVFASNNYLGLVRDERVVDAAATAARDIGTGASGSRIMTGDTVAHREFECDLAATKGTDRALTFSSGYAANLGIITSLYPNVIFSDEYNHTSIIEGARMSGADVVTYDHCNVDDLAAQLAREARERESTEGWLVITDTVFSMDGTVAPLAGICDVAEEYDAWVMADEAHATGLYDGGGGIVQEKGLEDRIQIQMGTLSKALASQGGYLAADETTVAYIANSARSFLFSAGLNPPAVAAAHEALRLAKTTNLRDELWANVAHLRDGLTDAGYDIRGNSQVLPVMIRDASAARGLEERLQQRGLLIQSVAYPAVPAGTSRIRLIPTAAHTTEQIDRCIEAFTEVGRDLDVI